MGYRFALVLCVVLSLFVCGVAFAAAEQLAEVSTTFTRVYAVSADSNDGTVWLADETRGIAHVTSAGMLLSRTTGFSGVLGVSVNQSDSTVWIADTDHDQVVHLQDNGDRTTTELLRMGGFLKPEGISVDPTDGTVWVADTENGAVVHIQDNGDGSGTELLRVTGFTDPVAVSVNPTDGTVWIGDTGTGDVVHLQDDGDGTATELLRFEDLSEPASVSVNPTDGTVWIADSTRSRVFHVQDDGDGTATTLVQTNALAMPVAVSVNPIDGTCWAASTYYGQVIHCKDNGDGTATALSTIATPKEPLSVSVDVADGSCWVGGYGNAIHYDASGTELMRTPHLYYSGAGVAVDPADGSIWIADGDSGAVIHASKTGAEISRIDGYDEPVAVDVNETDGTCWVAIHVSLDGMVVRLKDNGDGTISELSRATGFKEPYALSVNSSDGTCWVANTVGGQIVHLEDNGDGSMTELLRLGGFDWPFGIDVNPTDGTCWVGNTMSWQLVHVEDDGDGTGTELLRVGGFNHPYSVSVDPNDGTCWAALYYGNAVVHVQDDGDGTATTLATATGLTYASAVAVNPTDGTCWAADGSTVKHLQDNDAGSISVLSSSPKATGRVSALGVNPVDGSCWVPDVLGAEVIFHLGIETAPDAQFVGSPDSGAIPLDVSFTDLSTGYPVSWEWDFGDGSGSASQNPVHTYETEGNFNVSLTVTNSSGSHSLTKLTYISALTPTGSVEAAFSATPVVGSAPLLVNFTDQSTGDPTSWAWDFGDGTTSTEQNPSHEYTDPSYYTVTLTVGDGVFSDTKSKAQYVSVAFPDAPLTSTPPHWAAEAIIACATGGIVQGFPDGSYMPDESITRGQMAVYIARALALGDDNVPDFTGTPSFPDVDAEYWALDYVEYAVDLNVVAGYDDGYYHPEYEVTRDQMAVYVARALVAPTGEAALASYSPSDPRNFADVPNTGYGAEGTDPFWAYIHVEYCVEHGVVAGYDDGMYHPEWVVTRDQMAVYIARAFGLI